MPVSNRQLRMLVDPPRRVPMPYGLFSSVELRSESDPHWKLGVEYQPLCGGAGTTFDYCVTGAPPPALVDTGGRDMRGALPFTVYAEIDCSPVGTNWDQAYTDVANLLETTEQYQVERAFWTGNVAGSDDIALPHLADNTPITSSIVANGLSVTLQTAATIVTGSAVSPTAGIGALEAALAACYDGAGVLHVPVSAIPAMANGVMFYRDGARLRTFNGNYVVAGAGYSNTSPAGVPAGPGQAWIYATGQIFMYKGEIKTFARESSLDRNTNTLKAIAQRTFLLGWDCCHFAVLINL